MRCVSVCGSKLEVVDEFRGDRITKSRIYGGWHTNSMRCGFSSLHNMFQVVLSESCGWFVYVVSLDQLLPGLHQGVHTGVHTGVHQGAHRYTKGYTQGYTKGYTQGYTNCSRHTRNFDVNGEANKEVNDIGLLAVAIPPQNTSENRGNLKTHRTNVRSIPRAPSSLF